MRQLVGLLGVLGILLHGGGQLFHAGGGFFQAGGLLFGALRQDPVLPWAISLEAVLMDSTASLICIDQFLEVFHRGVDAVLGLAEQAGVVLGDGLGQVATRQGVGDAHDISQAGIGDIGKLVKQFGQGLGVTLLAVHVHLDAEFAPAGGGFNHLLDFGDDFGECIYGVIHAGLGSGRIRRGSPWSSSGSGRLPPARW